MPTESGGAWEHDAASVRLLPARLTAKMRPRSIPFQTLGVRTARSLAMRVAPDSRGQRSGGGVDGAEKWCRGAARLSTMAVSKLLTKPSWALTETQREWHGSRLGIRAA